MPDCASKGRTTYDADSFVCPVYGNAHVVVTIDAT